MPANHSITNILSPKSYLSAVDFGAGAANKVSSASSSNRLLLDGLGLGFAGFCTDFGRELMEADDWLDLTLDDRCFSPSDHSLSSYNNNITFYNALLILLDISAFNLHVSPDRMVSTQFNHIDFEVKTMG